MLDEPFDNEIPPEMHEKLRDAAAKDADVRLKVCGAYALERLGALFAVVCGKILGLEVDEDRE